MLKNKLLKALMMLSISALSVLSATNKTVYAEGYGEALSHCGLETVTVNELPEDTLIKMYSSNYYGDSEEDIYWQQFSSDYYYSFLSDAEKTYWNQMEQLCERYMVENIDAESIVYAGNDVYMTEFVSYESVIRLQEIGEVFIFAHPQYYFISNQIWTSGTNTALGIYPEFANGENRMQKTQLIKQQIESYLSQINDSDYPETKERKIHDLLCERVSYEFGQYDQSIYSTFIEEQTVCAGYTKAFELLCQAKGIDTIAITGTCDVSEETTRHAWNKVNLHGHWYVVDVTWDDQNTICYSYYNQNDRNTIDHKSAEVFKNIEPISEYVSSRCMSYEYCSSYFIEDEITYFSVNNIEPRLALVVDNPQNRVVPSTVQNDDYEYTVMKENRAYTITYYLDGGTNHPSNPAEYYETDDSIDLKEPTKEGYTFEGWYLDSTFSDDARITTIASGNTGDLIIYARFKKIENHFTGLAKAEDGSWYLYQDGNVNTSYSDLYYDETCGWWKVKEGVVDSSFTGIYNSPSCGFWLIRNGSIAFDYNGLWGDEQYGWWLIRGGAVAFGYDDLYCDSELGWWKVKNGAVDFGYTGLYYSENCGWWLIGGGKIVFDYTDLWGDPVYGWWKVAGGTVDFGYTGLYYSENCGWWLIGGGSVAFGYNDLWNDPICGWWKVAGGAVDFGYTGMYTSPTYGNWYISNGAVIFN